ARGELNERVTEISQLVEPCLVLSQGIRKRLKGKVTLEQVQADADIKAQLAALIFPGFVSAIGAHRLPDVVRYLQAIESRLDKLPVDTTKDRPPVYVMSEVT